MSAVHESEIDVWSLVHRELILHPICYPYVATHNPKIQISLDRVGTIEVTIKPMISKIIVEQRRTPELGPPRF